VRVLFTDTESTDLSASWGRILCCSHCELGGKPWTVRGDEKPYVGKNKVDDSKLVTAIRDEWEASDIVVTWNGILHDVPLVNARLAKANLDPVRIGARHGTIHLDLMFYSGGQSLKIGGRRLATVSKFFGTDNSKTPLDGETWQLAAAGEKDAMDLVVEHCEADVLVLRDLWPKLAPMVKKHQFTLSEVWPHIQQIPSRKVA
jgi:uncharacterized protein YprB with RNaseH-like and TPR domain